MKTKIYNKERLNWQTRKYGHILIHGSRSTLYKMKTAILAQALVIYEVA